METKPAVLRQPTSYWITLASKNQVNIYVSLDIIRILKLSATPSDLGFWHFGQLMSIAAAVWVSLIDKLLPNQVTALCLQICFSSRVRMF